MTQMTAFLLTLVIEAPLVVFAFRKHSRPISHLLLWSMVPSMVTHPFLWMVLSNIAFPVPYYYAVAFCEIIVVVVEALLIKFMFRASLGSSLLISFIVNLASVLCGLLMQRFWE